MKGKMARAISRRHRYKGVGSVGGQLAGCPVQEPNVNAVLCKVGGKNKLAGEVGLNHVRMRRIVSADSKTARGRSRGGSRSQGAHVGLDVGRIVERSV